MKKIIAFGASSSSTSINQALAVFSAGLLEGVDVQILSMKPLEEVPIYSSDRHKEGIPAAINELWENFKSVDGFLVSFAEHNGSYTAVFKNVFDWLSVIEGGVWNGKPVFVMGTSPGARGALTVIEAAEARFQWNNGTVTHTFSLPSFGKTFDAEKGITDAEKLMELKEKLGEFTDKL